MSDSETFGFHPDTEGILSVKQQLAKASCNDRVLLSNLDFSERVFRNNPLNKVVTLLVLGQWQVVRIGKADGVIYTVSCEDGETRIDCCVRCDGDAVKESDIKELHFSVHSCQDQSRSCFTAAKDTAKQHAFNKQQALKITCNRFSITYNINVVPDKIVHMETKCTFKLASHMTGEALLKIKCWMEREKPNCHEMIRCLDYLLEIYLPASAAPTNNCRFILHGNKEIAEINAVNYPNQITKQYIVKCGENSQVCIYPPFN